MSSKGHQGTAGFDAQVVTDEAGLPVQVNLPRAFETADGVVINKRPEVSDEEWDAALASGRVAGSIEVAPEEPTPPADPDEVAHLRPEWVDDEEWAAAIAAGRVKL